MHGTARKNSSGVGDVLESISHLVLLRFLKRLQRFHRYPVVSTVDFYSVQPPGPNPPPDGVFGNIVPGCHFFAGEEFLQCDSSFQRN